MKNQVLDRHYSTGPSMSLVICLETWLMIDPLLETRKDSTLPRRMFLEWKLYSLIIQLDEMHPRREERASRASRRLMRVM
jgi:hypothetical protein